LCDSEKQIHYCPSNTTTFVHLETAICFGRLRPSSGQQYNTVGSRFATVHFTTIHFYDSCPVGPSTPDLWCITVATQVSFLYLVRF